MAEYRPASAHEALAEFFDDLALQGLSPATIRTYRYQLKRIADLPLCDLDRTYFRALMVEATRTKAPQTARTIHGILSSFSRWLAGRGYTAVNVMDGVGQPKQPDIPVSSLSEPQIVAIREACRTDHERLVIGLLLATGLRRAELASARWEDLDLDQRTLSVIGKGRHRRTVLIPADLMALMGPKGKGRIIGLEGNAIWKLAKRVGTRAGLPWLRPHMLRHTWATGWMLRGGSTFHLQTLGGWRTDKMVRTRYARAAIEAAALDEARRMEG